MEKPYIIVFGNEKGGTGKSTFAMHVTVSLLQQGFQVGSIDLDGRQGTLSRYIGNRTSYHDQKNSKIPMPFHIRLSRSELTNVEKAQLEEQKNLEDAIAKMAKMDFLVIDTPGNDTFLSRTGHGYADLLITPLNDSFIDLDLLARIENPGNPIFHPSIYSEMVWQQRKVRALRDGGQIEWIVLRNRLSGIKARNRAQMEKILLHLSKRIGFRLGDGFVERVIFKELFLSGLTILDLEQAKIPFTLSHVAARQELRNLMLMIPNGHNM